MNDRAQLVANILRAVAALLIAMAQRVEAGKTLDDIIRSITTSH